MEIKTVAVLGAGAVGSYIIWGLDKKVKLGVIGEGERAKRLQKGCLINDQMYYPEVWSPTEAHGVGLLIVSLKYCALKDVLKSIQTIVDDHTIVMSLMNGVDSEEIIGEAIGAMKTKVSLICRKLIKGMSQSDIAELLEEDASYVKKICDAIGDNPEKCDVDEVVRKLME